MMAFLCAQTVANDIEVVWVKGLIQKTHLCPPKNIVETENWP